jgi:hypothetical protein
MPHGVNMDAFASIRFSRSTDLESDEFSLFVGDPRFFEQFEGDGFFNLRTSSRELLPMFRVSDPPKGSSRIVCGFRVAETMSPEMRRKPRTNPALLDLFMEIDRFLHFPHLPSRNYSSMANLLGFQPQYLSGGKKRVYLILPEKGARVALSAIRDFVVLHQSEAVQ